MPSTRSQPSAALAVLAVAVLASTGCKKLAPIEIVSAEEQPGFYSEPSQLKLEIKTAPDARVEVWGEHTYADSRGEATLKVPRDKVQAKPGGRGAVFVNVMPPTGKGRKRLKENRALVEFAWPAVLNVSGGKTSCGSKQCTGTIDSSGSKVEMQVDPGTTVTIDGKKLPAPVGGKISGTIDLGKRVREAPPYVLGKERATYKFTMPLSIAFADGTKLDSTLSRDGGSFEFANKAFSAIDKGPVRFGGEPDGPSAGKSVTLYSIIGSTTYGTAKTIGDIDLVALSTWSTRTASCGTYRGATTGRIISMDRTLHDEDVSVYERRSGKRVGRRAFSSDVPSCPSSMSSNSSLNGYVSSSTIEAWLKTFIK